MKKLLVFSLVTTYSLFAGGYKIPETSLNAVALSAANIAHNHSADTAYYNPANMIFMNNENSIELDLTYIKLNAINYKGSHTSSGTTTYGYDTDSKQEAFYIPTLHYVSGKTGETRIGLSITAPGGLSKRWDDAPAVASAKEFTLEIIEINPSVAFPINDKLAFAIGFRIVHTDGVVKSNSNAASRDLTGDSIDYGYNLALSYKPTAELETALTYRSQVDLTVNGNAKLRYLSKPTYDGEASVTVPLPATASFAIAYTFASKTTIEFVYERNFWSAYKDLDFSYGDTIDPTVNAVFGNPVPKDWKDTNAIRLGITQKLDNFTLMAGVVYDETPAPEKTTGYELPDSNSLSVSFGGRYQITKKLDIGLAMLYSMRESRKVTNSSIDGEFTNADIMIISTGIGYKF